MRRLFVAANWKMNTTTASASRLAQGLAARFPSESEFAEILVCPPFPYLSAVGAVISDSGVQLGAQNVYFESPGAFTGEVAVEMLLDVGCRWAIIGHSERRHVLGETDDLINKKVIASLQEGLKVILCVGELLDQREAGKTESVLDSQMAGSLKGLSTESLQNVVVAYEPVWAIGTGVTATPEQANSAHDHLRKWLINRYNSELGVKTRILYGGSVKPENALSLMQQPEVDGALVGGASLEAESFGPIVEAAFQLAAK